MIKEKIVDRHGRIESVRLFKNEPSEEQLSMKTPKNQPEVEVADEEVPSAEGDQQVENTEKKPKKEEPAAFLAEEFEDDTDYLYNIFRDRK